MAFLKDHHRRYKVTISIIAASIFLLSQCMNAGEHKEAGNDTTAKTTTPAFSSSNFEKYAGSDACATCHRDIYTDFNSTAHHLTSAMAARSGISGSFENGKNAFWFNPATAVMMEQQKDSFYQVMYQNGVAKLAKPMEIVIGSGTMGQSFLYWQHNRLFQLPITFFSAANAWSNSPGYPNHPVFDRDITARCMECHSTYAAVLEENSRGQNLFDRKQIVLGVECEKCHGPGAQHVDFHTQHRNDTSGQFIINPALLSRQQSLDLCALCHGGRLQKTKPAFSFVAGDTLSQFFATNTNTIPDPNSVDVHGNQYGLLQASKCFRSSTMTCNTCHDTHKNEQGQTALFSIRCLGCHTGAHQQAGAIQKALGAAVNTNCIDCHMPLYPSRAIAVFLPGKKEATAALIRTHYIAVYPEETQKVIAYLKQHPR